MSTFRIKWIEQKISKTGKTFATLTLVDSEGNERDNVSVWADFPGFGELRPEGQIVGNLTVKSQGGRNYTNIVPEKNLNGTYKPRTPISPIAQTSKAVEAAQDRKNDSIKNSSTFRDATLLTLEWRKERSARGLATTADEWQAEWRNCRKWLEARYDEPFA